MSDQTQLESLAKTFVETGDVAWSGDYYLARFRRELVLSRIARGRCALEIGSAEGGMTNALAAHFEKVVALDASATMIELTRKQVRASNVEFVCQMIENYTPAEAFDAIVMACVLEHVAEAVPVLRRMRSWLAPGGKLHVVVPNAGAMNRQIGCLMGLLSTSNQLHDRDCAQGHYRVYHWDGLLSDLRTAGWIVTDILGNFLKPLSDSQMAGFSPELMRAFFELGRQLPTYCAEIYAIAEPVP